MRPPALRSLLGPFSGPLPGLFFLHAPCDLVSRSPGASARGLFSVPRRRWRVRPEGFHSQICRPSADLLPEPLAITDSPPGLYFPPLGWQCLYCSSWLVPAEPSVPEPEARSPRRPRLGNPQRRPSLPLSWPWWRAPSLSCTTVRVFQCVCHAFPHPRVSWPWFLSLSLVF